MKYQLKLNVNASILDGGSLFTLGMVVRDYQGRFIKGKNMTVIGMTTMMEAEVRGVHEGIYLNEEMGLQHIIIKSDSELVVHGVNKGTTYYLNVDHILDVCKSKPKERVNLSLYHTKKQANRVAHLMARVPCLLNSYNVLFEGWSYPGCLQVKAERKD